jgi:hypothetical protein
MTSTVAPSLTRFPGGRRSTQSPQPRIGRLVTAQQHQPVRTRTAEKVSRTASKGTSSLVSFGRPLWATLESRLTATFSFLSNRTLSHLGVIAGMQRICRGGLLLASVPSVCYS